MNTLRQYLLPVVLLVLLVQSLLHFGAQCVTFSESRLYDLPLFTQAAVRYWQGEPLYIRADDLLNQYKPGAIVFKFPPPYLFPFLPWFDASGVWPDHFHGGFIAVGAALYAWMLLLACRLVLNASRQGAALVFPGRYHGYLVFTVSVVIAACWFVPVLHVLGATSIENFLLCMAVVAFTVMRRYPWLAGFILAYLAMVKLYPAFLLAYPLLTRQWRVLWSAAVSWVLIAFASVAIFGWEENRFYVTQILPILMREPVSEDWTDVFKHASGNLGIVKVLVTYGLLPNRNAEWLNAIRLPLVSVMAWLLWTRVKEQQTACLQTAWPPLLGYALVMVTMMACLPNLFYPYLIILLFPLIVLCGWLVQRQQWGWLLVVLLPLSSLWIDDAWTMAQANAHQLLNPAPALTQHIEQTGVWTYLWQEQKALAFLMLEGRVVPFTPYVLWLALAVCLFRETRANPDQ